MNTVNKQELGPGTALNVKLIIRQVKGFLGLNKCFAIVPWVSAIMTFEN